MAFITQVLEFIHDVSAIEIFKGLIFLVFGILDKRYSIV